MKVIQLFCVFFLISSCISKENHSEIKERYDFKYGTKYSMEKNDKDLIITVLYSSEFDFVKSGIFSQMLLKDLDNVENAFFFFKLNKVKDTLTYKNDEIQDVKQLYNQNPCLIQSSEHILNLSSEKIVFYDSILYDIMIYDSKLQNLDTAYYAKSDVSIVSILFNRCLYSEDSIPEKYEKQWKYLQVIPIWCDDRKLFPLYNPKDLEVTYPAKQDL